MTNAVKSTDGERIWINDLELRDVQVKWPFSHFDGRKDTFNEEGDHNFTIVLEPELAHELMKIPNGWNIKERAGREEGDPPEYTLKVKISYKYERPQIFLIKGDKRFRADEEDLADIKRSTCEQIDLVASPSRWVQPDRTGVTAYVKEMYVKIRESRFAQEYADYEDADAGPVSEEDAE